MRAFLALLKKEFLEGLRSRRLVILGLLFVLFGIMNPAIAKLTPWIVELTSESLASAGMTVGEVTVDALTSWTQFFKNIPMALIVFLLMYSSSFTGEYQSGSLILILTKGVSRYKIVLSKALTLLTLWTAGYWLCYAVTYAYTAYYWDQSIMQNLAPATINWWLFGVWTVCLSVVFSVLSRSYSTVLLGTGGCVLASYLLGQIPKLWKFTPTALTDSMALLTGAKAPDKLLPALLVTVGISLLCVGVSIPIFNKKQL